MSKYRWELYRLLADWRNEIKRQMDNTAYGKGTYVTSTPEWALMCALSDAASACLSVKQVQDIGRGDP